MTNEIKKHIVYIKCNFEGFYFWGEGWSIENMYKWANYWKGIKSIFWKYVKCGDSEHLVCTNGSCYLHPLNFSVGLFDCGVTCDGKYFSSEVKELVKLCKDCAEVMGGTFSYTISDETEVSLTMSKGE